MVARTHFVEQQLTKGDVYISQKYSQEFKEPFVRLHDSCNLVSELVKEYGIANQAIYKCIKRSKRPAGQNSNSLSLHQVQEMLKEMTKMKEETIKENHKDKPWFFKQQDDG